MKFSAVPSLENLSELVEKHTQTFAFENLNPLLGLPVHLDFDSLFRKFVLHSRGGYCYEQNLLFMEVLKTLGYRVRGITGRVIQSGKRDGRRTHMLLQVKLNETVYIVDVGFRGMVPTAPLILKEEIVQSTPHEKYKLETDSDNSFVLNAEVKEKWRPLYRFYLQEQYFSDYEVGNWYTSTHPDSGFTKRLSVAISGVKCRYTLKNNTFLTHYFEKPSETVILSSVDDIIDILGDVFRIKLSGLLVEDVAARLSELIPVT